MGISGPHQFSLAHSHGRLLVGFTFLYHCPLNHFSYIVIYIETQNYTSDYKALEIIISLRITLKLFCRYNEQARAQIATLLMVSFWWELSTDHCFITGYISGRAQPVVNAEWWYKMFGEMIQYFIGCIRNMGKRWGAKLVGGQVMRNLACYIREFILYSVRVHWLSFSQLALTVL